VPRGILCMIVATVLFSAASAARKWLVGIKSSRRGAMPAFAGLLHCRRRSDLAGQRLVGLCDASAARSSGARAFAIDLAAVPASRIQPDAARRRRRHQLLRTALRGPGFDCLAQCDRPMVLDQGLAPGAGAPAVTRFYYLMLVWALIFGFVIWGEVPSAGLLVGSTIVVTTGLFLFLREARLQRQLAAR